MALIYNTKDLIETDSCPDPRLLLPDLLKRIAKITKLKICEVEKGSREYIDTEVNNLKQILNTVNGNLSQDTLEKLQKVADLFIAIDKNSDGSLSELTSIITQVTKNTNSLEIIKTAIEKFDGEIVTITNKIDNLSDRIDVLEQDSHTHEVSQKEMVCQLSKNMIQAFNTGLTKFEEEMNKSCDLVLTTPGGAPVSNISNTNTTSESTSSTSTTTESSTNTTSTSSTTNDSSSDNSADDTATSPII